MGPPDQFNASPVVLAKTERWLALAKPAGWLTIPGRAPGVPVVSEWAEREHGKVWVVHRLDRETSGVLLMALTAEAHREANAWFAGHRVRKAYDFLAAGEMGAPLARVNEPVEGAASLTQVELRERYAGCFLGRAVPMTGRRHQIRIHLASRGNPLLGDGQYRGPESMALRAGSLEVGRVALHASRLELPSGERFEAAWPDDFKGWVEALRGETT